MKIGIDINNKTISAALVGDDNTVNFIDESIYNVRRDCNKTIIKKLLGMIHQTTCTHIDGIGLSLPSKIDSQRGTIFDLGKIPYWKGHKIKKILEEEFSTQVWINNDTNCFLLAEKKHGLCQEFNDVICLTLGSNVGTGVIKGGKLFMGNKYMLKSTKCLSTPCYDAIRLYKESYNRTVDELSSLCAEFEKDEVATIKQSTWNEIGSLTGKLVSILLSNYDAHAVVLGGNLAHSYKRFATAMDKYLEKVIHPHILLNLAVIVSVVDHPHALGAASMVNPVLS
ncbi:MAG: ROK family protein [Dysgonomonas sp.]|nr:ROK family protein [Dysgonomonas sp.]